MKRDPWELGRLYAQQSGEMPTQRQLKARWGIKPRQGLLFAFGFAQGRGQKFPPMFREKLEWLCREPSQIDDQIIAIDTFAIGMDEKDQLIFQQPGDDITHH